MDKIAIVAERFEFGPETGLKEVRAVELKTVAPRQALVPCKDVLVIMNMGFLGFAHGEMLQKEGGSDRPFHLLPRPAKLELKEMDYAWVIVSKH